MHPSIARFSDMPGRNLFFFFFIFNLILFSLSQQKHMQNPWWGDSSVIRMKGVTQYTLSPFQSKTAPHMLRNYLFNGYRRISAEAVFFVIPFAIGYGIYAWANSYDAYQNSKAGHIASSGHH
ncbi:hypothetical protein L208DRAFT_1420173 [Tricholoma matsutake]|nr:hypothetical protein L208DRAFT_1420173 [Tricholoma matsutake 945]